LKNIILICTWITSGRKIVVGRKVHEKCFTK